MLPRTTSKVASLLGALLLVSCSKASKSPPDAAAPQSPPASPPSADLARAWLSKASRTETQGWIVVHLQGAAQERGYQHGSLLAKDIAAALEARRAVWAHTSGRDWPWLIDMTRTLLTPKVDPELLAEIDGIVQGAASQGVVATRDDLVALNAWLELIWYWWPAYEKRLKGDAPAPLRDKCSAFIATGSMTIDGRIVAGHNTWDYLPQSDAYVVLDVVPDKGHRIVMQAEPGLVHSNTDFFVTGAGLIGTETTMGGCEAYDESGIPEFVRCRRACQDASSIDEWVSVMKKGNNGGYANAWLIGDIKTNEIARLELGLKNVSLERTHDGYYVGSNIAENIRIGAQENESPSDDLRYSPVSRRARWHELMKQHKGKLDTELGKKFLADHYDSWLKVDGPGARTLCGHMYLDPFGYRPNGAAHPPWGTCDGKVVDAAMASKMSFAARWGSPCGMPFDPGAYLAEHPEHAWMQPWLRPWPTQQWVDVP